MDPINHCGYKPRVYIDNGKTIILCKGCGRMVTGISRNVAVVIWNKNFKEEEENANCSNF